MPFPELVPALRAAAGVVTTSEWTRGWVLARGVPPDRVHVARPGVDLAGSAQSGMSQAGGVPQFLCLAAVTRGKGHDLLLAALNRLTDLDWACTCVGALDLEPDFVAELRALPVADRVRFTGPLTGRALETALADADLLVSASRHEAYGMAVTEALAHGIPVVATDVGGHAEAVGGGGVLVPPEDPGRLAAVLRLWLTDAAERDRLRTAARSRRATLGSWSATAERVAAALDMVNPPRAQPVSPP
jgi:glycosyltransferase involved in cell wall biosynthesis